MSKDILIIGVAGGSGSGKTTFASRLQDMIGPSHCGVVGQDSYYIDQSSKFDHDGGSVNFDHPNSLDFNLMGEHLFQIKQGSEIQIPIYDFATHSRLEKTNLFTPKRIVFVDGILIFSQDPVLEQLDHKVFIDCPEELRFSRRLNRDVKERGRTPEGVKNQFLKQVKPMHDEFVEPSKDHACDIVCVDDFDEKLDKWAEYITKNFL
ncbi:uridine kinase [Bacteriovorax sp. DB6_IX]|uniref:uridine kinase n=1 Tax=Bacteriovorax sp. DB6_IX TaxID=1353530 RepID=UPI000389E0A4|nr:uridine kinase [Bacteriovorax sp. DB6_IX]EQC51024.1 putative uridine kinase [Bacteriovorax sp. DB6_IX]